MFCVQKRYHLNKEVVSRIQNYTVFKLTKLIHVQTYYSTERRKCEDSKDD